MGLLAKLERMERMVPRPRRTGPAATRPAFGLDWMTTFLPHYMTAAPSQLHLDLAADLATLHADRGQRRCYVAPRGGAKTTWLSKAYPLYCAVEGLEPLTLLLAETGQQAEAYLAAVKKELEANAGLARTYPGAVGVGPVWRTDRITLRNGCTLVARGAGGRILGLTEGAARPTLVVGDDLNQRADAYSPTLRRRKTDWFLRDVLNVGEPRTNYLAAGTPIHREAVVCELDRNGGWQTRRYRAVLRWPDDLDLWDRWERLLTNLADEHRGEAARAFYEANCTRMNAGAVVLWPDREPLYDLMLKRAEIGPAAFGSEKMDQPGLDGAVEWPEEYFSDPSLWFWEWPDNLRLRLIALDPSKGNDSMPGDFQAFVMGGFAHDGTIYLDAELRREPVTEMVARGLRLYREFGASELAVEINATMGLLLPEFRRQCRDAGRQANVVGLNNLDPKMVRIRHTGSYLARRQIRVRNTPGGRMLVDQWRDVPGGEYDDAADAAAMLLSRMEYLAGNPDQHG